MKYYLENEGDKKFKKLTKSLKKLVKIENIFTQQI